MSGMEIVFRPDPHVLDGRFANNAWLQELPKPLSKVTWDNVAYISPKTADGLNIPVFRSGNDSQKMIAITYGGQTVRMPVWVLPGTADDTVVVHFGYGRTRAGRVGTGIGVDAFPLRTSAAPWFDGGATVAVTTDIYPIASTQNHFMMEGRNPVRVVELEAFRANPHAVEELGHHRPAKTMTLYPQEHPVGKNAVNRWGMSIDLNACTGCGVCVAACVAENNIPVVGKAQVSRSREMHWLRVDTYFEFEGGEHHTLNEKGLTLDGHLPSAVALPAVRKRALRSGVPGRRDRAQRRRPERHGLQPLRRHAVLLEQLSVQGPALQLHVVCGLRDAGAVRAAESGRHDSQPRRHGKVHVLRPAHQPRAD